jgi:hypothetical protein
MDALLKTSAGLLVVLNALPSHVKKQFSQRLLIAFKQCQSQMIPVVKRLDKLTVSIVL